MLSFDNPATFDNILLAGKRMLKHSTQVYFVELPIQHAFKQMRTKFQIPIPPHRPILFLQKFSP